MKDLKTRGLNLRAEFEFGSKGCVIENRSIDGKVWPVIGFGEGSRGEEGQRRGLDLRGVKWRVLELEIINANQVDKAKTLRL